MTDYYNEIDPFAAQWLRNLIEAGELPYGVVDERDIRDVAPADLRDFRQCHFFAGIGVFPRALMRLGFTGKVWTGSCPCQPFSAAGRGAGFADERHLWPAFHWIINQVRPELVMGEQVASKDGLAWLDLVCADLEGSGYASRATDMCAAGIGAPHIRQRLFWAAKRLADGASSGLEGAAGPSLFGRLYGPASDAVAGILANPSFVGWRQGVKDDGGLRERERDREEGSAGRSAVAGPVVTQRMGDSIRSGLEGFGGDVVGAEGRDLAIGPGLDASFARGLANADSAGLLAGRWHDAPMGHGSSVAPACSDDRQGPSGPLNGFWGAADWLYCRDGKWRPVRSGSFPLVNGAPARVGRLRAYGNAIVAPLAEEFARAVFDEFDL